MVVEVKNEQYKTSNTRANGDNVDENDECVEQTIKKRANFVELVVHKNYTLQIVGFGQNEDSIYVT